MDTQIVSKVELCAEPSAFSPGEYRACIKLDGWVSYLSQQSWKTPDMALRAAALVFAGEAPGYRY